MQKSIHALSSCTLVRVVHLLVILVLLVVDDVEELELVDSLASGDDAEPVTELHLLEELLGPGDGGRVAVSILHCGFKVFGFQESLLQVLDVAAGQVVVGNDLNLALTSLLDLDVVTKVANAAVDLDLVLEELLEGGGVEDLVASGLLSVDNELEEGKVDELASRRKTGRERGLRVDCSLTFLVVLACLPLGPDFFCKYH